MAVAFHVYYEAGVYVRTGVVSLIDSNIKLALLSKDYTPDLDVHEVWADLTDGEVTPTHCEVADGDGYTAGGLALTGLSVSRTEDSISWDAANATFASLTKTFKYGVIYLDATVGAVVKPLIAVIDFDDSAVTAEVTATAQDFIVTWNDDGMWMLGPKGAGSGVFKTGSTVSYATGDDGYYQAGIAWANPRFTDNGDGTVTDNNTGLMWIQNPGGLPGNNSADLTWAATLTLINDLTFAGHSDWRMPNVLEVLSLGDNSNNGNSPALAPGSGIYFDGGDRNFGWDWIWTSTVPDGIYSPRSLVVYPDYAFYVSDKLQTQAVGFAFPVRGGNI